MFATAMHVQGHRGSFQMSTTILGRSQVGAVATSCGVGGLDCTVDRRIASTMIMNFMGQGGAPPAISYWYTTAATVRRRCPQKVSFVCYFQTSHFLKL
jgi:hypothetical protein